MASSDDEDEIVPHAVSDYHFVENDEPISFVELPVQWSEETLAGKKKQIFLHGTTDNGLQRIYRQVIAWKFDILDATPEILVLTKENNWIKLQKPRKSFLSFIKTILITVHCLHFSLKNPEASGQSMWDHLAKVFSSYEIRPSENDLVDHMCLIGEAVKRDKRLKKSQFLSTFLKEKLRKRKASDEVVQTTATSSFIVGIEDNIVVDNDNDSDEENIVDDNEEADSDEVGDTNDSVCAFCDEGGDLLCCEGGCRRSFHATIKAGVYSSCTSLGLTDDQVKAIRNFICKNCELQQHQCFYCGKLGSSDKLSGAEVFSCHCGRFYHPGCVSKLLHWENEAIVKEVQEKIAIGESFICPVHKCSVCNQEENKEVLELQFAMCRRCPKSYHRKCLPRKIAFEVLEDDEPMPVRAWDGILPDRILIYCLKHEIDEELGTPLRNHIKFPGEEKKKIRESQLPLRREKRMVKKISLSPRAERRPKQVDLGKRSLTFRKSEGSDASRKSLGDNSKSVLLKAHKSSQRSESKKLRKGIHDSEREQIVTVDPSINDLSSPQHQLDDELPLVSILKKKIPVSGKRSAMKAPKQAHAGKRSSPLKKLKLTNDSSRDDNTPVLLEADKSSKKSDSVESSDVDRIGTIEPVMNNLGTCERQLEPDTERSLLEEMLRKHESPSTHVFSPKTCVDKAITQGKVDDAIASVRTALEKLDASCSIEDAKAVCEPNVVDHLIKFKRNLKVHLAPLLRGTKVPNDGEIVMSEAGSPSNKESQERHDGKMERVGDEPVAPQTRQRGEPLMDFAPGPNCNFSEQSSSGWLIE